MEDVTNDNIFTDNGSPPEVVEDVQPDNFDLPSQQETDIQQSTDVCKLHCLICGVAFSNSHTIGMANWRLWPPNPWRRNVSTPRVQHYHPCMYSMHESAGNLCSRPRTTDFQRTNGPLFAASLTLNGWERALLSNLECSWCPQFLRRASPVRICRAMKENSPHRPHGEGICHL